MTRTIAVYLEIGDKRTFAGAIDWPGWCRSGRTEEAALEALAAYASRYAKVVARTRHSFEASREPELEVGERLPGGSGTDFGVPGASPEADEQRVDAKEIDRQLALLQASWDTFDAAVTAAEGRTLRKGPRGGGRDLAKVVAHVVDADRGYLTQLGSKAPTAASGGYGDPIAALRARIGEALTARFRDEPVAEPNRVSKPWTPRYFVRRAAWHALDHAWEIEDRAEPA